MSDLLTTEILEKVLDKKFADYQSVLVEAMDDKFQRTDAKIVKLEVDVSEIKTDLRDVKQKLSMLEEKMTQLASTLDLFLKRLLDQEMELKIMKAEMSQVKTILKEKLGIEVRV